MQFLRHQDALGFKLAKADVSEMPLLEQRFGKANFSDCHLFEGLVGPFLGRLPLEATGAELPDGILPRVTSLVRFQIDQKNDKLKQRFQMICSNECTGQAPASRTNVAFLCAGQKGVLLVGCKLANCCVDLPQKLKFNGF